MKKKVTPELKEKVIDLRKKGHMYKEISAQTGLGMALVHRICEEEGVYLTTCKDKQGMSDLWRQWDYLHRRYGKNE